MGEQIIFSPAKGGGDDNITSEEDDDDMTTSEPVTKSGVHTAPHSTASTQDSSTASTQDKHLIEVKAVSALGSGLEGDASH